MFVVVALVVWFAMSVPVALIVGRVLAASTQDGHAPLGARRTAPAGQRLARS